MRPVKFQMIEPRKINLKAKNNKGARPFTEDKNLTNNVKKGKHQQRASIAVMETHLS